MERRTDSVHSKDAMKARMYGRSFFVWGLSVALFSLPVAAENAWGGGEKRLILQKFNKQETLSVKCSTRMASR